MKEFIKASLGHFEVREREVKLRGLIFMLPIAINLFEGLGEKDEFVKRCTEAFDKDLDAR